MKKTLLLFTSLISTIIFAQAPINDFFSVPNSSYAIVNDATLDQSATGANLTWNFTDFTSIGVNTDTYSAPTSGELSTYPGTTEVLTVSTSGGGESKIYAKDMAGTFSLTGAGGTDVDLNYVTDNALVGTFPLNYNDTNNDAVSGTFTGQGISGTFTGTITSTVDAYGTLNMNDLGQGAYSGSVTRLKVVQNLSLTYIFPNVGTAAQTSYYYYDDNNGNLVFKSNTIQIVVAIAGINETTTLFESFLGTTLSTNDFNLASPEIQLFPNPVEDQLIVKPNNSVNITAMFVTDLNGRVIISKDTFQEELDTSILQSGMYILSIETDSGIITKKFLKK